MKILSNFSIVKPLKSHYYNYLNRILQNSFLHDDFISIHFTLCLKLAASQALVAHSYNPRYSGGRDQEDLGSKQIVKRTYLEKTLHKRGLAEWFKV
jgi:hypothetical protein